MHVSSSNDATIPFVPPSMEHKEMLDAFMPEARQEPFHFSISRIQCTGLILANYRVWGPSSQLTQVNS